MSNKITFIRQSVCSLVFWLNARQETWREKKEQSESNLAHVQKKCVLCVKWQSFRPDISQKIYFLWFLFLCHINLDFLHLYFFSLHTYIPWFYATFRNNIFQSQCVHTELGAGSCNVVIKRRELLSSRWIEEKNTRKLWNLSNTL